MNYIAISNNQTIESQQDNIVISIPTPEPISELDYIYLFDYDGELLHKYTKTELELLTELPNPPEHEHLIFQQWNWSLEDLKALDRGMMVGPMYTTKSGLNEFDIELDSISGLTIEFRASGTKDWGDGTSDTATSHTYAEYGKYTIKSSNAGSGSSTTNTNAFGGNYNNQTVFLKEARLVTSALSSYHFYWCVGLERISISTSLSTINEYSLGSTTNLSALSLYNVTWIRSQGLSGCGVRFLSLPNKIQNLDGYSLTSMKRLKIFFLPNSFTSGANDSLFQSGGFYYAKFSKNSKTINGYKYCYNLIEIDATNVENIGIETFYNCYNLRKIKLTDGLIGISRNAFNQCHSLTTLNLPDTVKTIGDYAFQGCHALLHLSLSADITTIGTNVISDSTALLTMDCSRAKQVPTLGGNNTIGQFCKIIVPDNLYEEWKSATNWAKYANQIYKASEVQL